MTLMTGHSEGNGRAEKELYTNHEETEYGIFATVLQVKAAGLHSHFEHTHARAHTYTHTQARIHTKTEELITTGLRRN